MGGGGGGGGGLSDCSVLKFNTYTRVIQVSDSGPSLLSCFPTFNVIL